MTVLLSLIGISTLLIIFKRVLHQVLCASNNILFILFYFILGLIIFDINTTDCDAGSNSDITYSITGGNSLIYSFIIIIIIINR